MRRPKRSAHTHTQSLIQKGVTAYNAGSQGKVWVRRQKAGARGKLWLQALLGPLRERKARRVNSLGLEI